MSAHAYTEDQLVEQPDFGLLAEQMALPFPHPRPFSHGEKGGQPAGLRVRSLVVLVSRLRTALERLNRALPPNDIATTSISLKRQVSRRGENPFYSETVAGRRQASLFEWPTAFRCKYLIDSMLLFELKTSQ